MNCYEELLSATSHKHAPWFVIPADNNWFRNVAISGILVNVMEGLKLKYPPPTFDPSGIKLEDESMKSVEKKAKKRRNKKAIDLDAQTTIHGSINQ
jgi:hypothetical protein